MTDLFTLAEEYDAMLNKGLSVSGENKEYFAAGRVDMVRKTMTGFTPKSILDFGCGIGATSGLLAQAFPESNVVGVDTSEEAIKYARIRGDRKACRFYELSDIDIQKLHGHFDICYVNGVFHHIDPTRRSEALEYIRSALAPHGLLFFFENNPVNPGTRIIMSRIPFDKNAKLLHPFRAKKMLRENGFKIRNDYYLFYFPRWLRFFRPLENILSRIPLGPSNLICAKKSE